MTEALETDGHIQRFDLLLRDGTVVNADGTRRVDVGVRQGKVAALLPPGEDHEAEEAIDCSGIYILPGCIDPHTHLWESGLVAGEDFSDVTRSAIAGGITTIIEHPLTTPEVLNRTTLEAKAELGERTSYCDFALYGGVSASNRKELRAMWEAGAAGLKVFMCRSGSAVEELDGPLLLEALKEIGSFGGIALFHAENQRLMDHFEAQLREVGRRDYMSLAEWRPPEVEAEAINRAIFFCGITGARGVFVHTSIPEAGDMAAAARARGVKVVIETCPHYLYLSTADLVEMGPWIKCQPPVRDRERVEALWKHVRAGNVAMIGSDHGPVDRELKESGLDDIWLAQGGMPSIETMIPLMLEAVAAGGLTIEQVASLCSTYAARWYGLYPHKGVISIGADADFTVVDLNAKWQVHAADLQSLCGWTPFEGWTIRGFVRYTIIRGLTIAADGRPTPSAKPGYGRFCRAQHEHAGEPEYAALSHSE